ncbi:MAG: 2Fe-2S iron-sulfur cluster-binding protein [Proteobacteria bacterium]|nr:2Fe-2S iron-sulfur cluster-binding protein [Pseudomonadota bacterium]
MAARETGFRLDGGCLIERSKPLQFRFNGKPMLGFKGDTLSSALLANGVGLLGRSFKYHRPRGIYGAGLEDPNAMVAVRDAYGYEPALRAGQVRLAEGLDAHTVTGWPSVDFDIGALAQLGMRFMKAGFYYKTFMWPTWGLYEPYIRKPTGFGSAEPVKPRHSEQRHDICDVLIIGGGVAGITAACGLLGAGLKVVLADEQPRLGGALMREGVTINGRPGAEWAVEQQAVFEAADEIDVLTDTVVTGAYEGNFFTLLQSDHDAGGAGQAGGLRSERLWKLHARYVVLATGSLDRPLVFEDNDRPGVMLSSAVGRFVGEYGVAPGRTVGIFTNNDSGHLTALSLLQAGLHVSAIIDTRLAPESPGVEATAAAGIRRLSGAEVVGTSGYKGLRSIDVAPVGGGAAERIDCSVLALSGGRTPLIHLATHLGVKPVFNPESGEFICPYVPDGWHIVGDAGGFSSFAKAINDGLEVSAVIRTTTGAGPFSWDVPKLSALESAPSAAFWKSNAGNPARMWVDLQNDVTVADIELAVREGYVSVEHLKRYTTLGMGTDQGRTSNINGLAILAGLTGRDIGDVGTTTFRPPYTAVRLSAIAHIRQNDIYRPRRRMPAHDAHIAGGAVFEDFGWQRPDWYHANGADRETAVAAEMVAVRGAVGLFDGSPLGKIEVTGPDAATFLDRFYVSNIMTLKPGRIRYSVMLKEDGVIFDDGVLTCIDEGYYLAGPSSGNAEMVASWFERWRQTEWPALEVGIAPVTSNWASVAIAGPRARELLAKLNPGVDLSSTAFPHMSYRECRLGGVAARISRVSFTGELQYEISVPARYGHDLVDQLMGEGEALGIQMVGMEAWLRLRLEKGYLHVGSDTNGRTTPGDIGMGGIVERKIADFIGKRSLSLAFSGSDEREELVGLHAGQGRLAPGGRIMAPDAVSAPCVTEGYITSACYSPSLGKDIGLALIERGRSRMGETVRIYDNGGVVEAEICSPVFYDPDNERLRA